MPRILIADQCEVVRWRLRQILEAQPGWGVVGEAADGKEAVLKAIALKPDVAVIEYLLPMMDGIGVTRLLRSRAPRTEILIFATNLEEVAALELLRAGARGYLLKSDPESCLLAAIASLVKHRPFFTLRIAETLLQLFLRTSNRARATLIKRPSRPLRCMGPSVEA